LNPKVHNLLHKFHAVFWVNSIQSYHFTSYFFSKKGKVVIGVIKKFYDKRCMTDWSYSFRDEWSGLPPHGESPKHPLEKKGWVDS
jgi:hypothetical protein